jgi:F0F1-type ATP synthase membrane subunit b/b'
MIEKLLNWYGAGPKWLKVVIIFVSVILLPLIIVAMIAYLVSTIPSKGDDILGGAIDAHEDYVKDRLDDLEADDKAGADAVEQAEERIEELDQQGFEASEERKSDHEKVDAANSWDDLDRIS